MTVISHIIYIVLICFSDTVCIVEYVFLLSVSFVKNSNF